MEIYYYQGARWKDVYVARPWKWNVFILNSTYKWTYSWYLIVHAPYIVIHTESWSDFDAMIIVCHPLSWYLNAVGFSSAFGFVHITIQPPFLNIPFDVVQFHEHQITFRICNTHKNRRKSIQCVYIWERENTKRKKESINVICATVPIELVCLSHSNNLFFCLLHQTQFYSFPFLSLFPCLFVQGKSLSIFHIFLNRKKVHIWFKKKITMSKMKKWSGWGMDERHWDMDIYCFFLCAPIIIYIHYAITACKCTDIDHIDLFLFYF